MWYRCRPITSQPNRWRNDGLFDLDNTKFNQGYRNLRNVAGRQSGSADQRGLGRIVAPVRALCRHDFLQGIRHANRTAILGDVPLQVQDEKGTRKIDIVTGAFVDAPPTPWHEFTNKGETTLQVLLVENKYQAASPLSQSVCPK
jgi:hypothetical protein